MMAQCGQSGAHHSSPRLPSRSRDLGQDDLFLNLAHDEETRRGVPAAGQSDGHGVMTQFNATAYQHNGAILPSHRKITLPRNLQSSVSTRQTTGDRDQMSTRYGERSRRLSSSYARRPTIREETTSNIAAQPTPNSRPPSSHRRKSLRPSELAYSTPGSYDQAISSYSRHLSGRPDADGAESVLSGAPSTVWDELTELKSRMKKLEYSTGHPRAIITPPETRESPETRERPQTSNTQTTASTSRHSSRGDLLSNDTTRVTSQDSHDLHPLLHSALRKARDVVSADVYRALEESASDALSLAALGRADTSSDVQSLAGSSFDGPPSFQKQITRRADSMCRSLTELCISLCDIEAQSGGRTPIRPGSRDKYAKNGTSSPLAYLQERRRLSQRYDASPLHKPNNHSFYDESSDYREAAAASERPIYSRAHSATNGSSAGTARPSLNLSRAPTTNTHSNSQYAATDYTSRHSSPDRDPTLRAPSRARTVADMTIGRSRAASHSPRDLRLSRDYTSRHPLPGTVPEGLPAARNDFNSPRHDASTMNNPSTRSSVAGSQRPWKSSDYRQAGTSDSSDRTERQRDNVRPRRSSTTSLRAPPSTGTGLAERLEAKRQQRVSQASQLRGEGLV